MRLANERHYPWRFIFLITALESVYRISICLSKTNSETSEIRDEEIYLWIVAFNIVVNTLT